jgi:hypothetical protein
MHQYPGGFQLLLQLINAKERRILHASITQKDADSFGKLLTQTTWHRMAPILYDHPQIIQLPADHPCRQRVATLKYKINRHALHAIRDLKELSAELLYANLDFLVFKGLPLSMQLFSSPLLRNARDIDILLRSRDIVKAHAILLKLGYRPLNLEVQPGMKSFDRYMAFQKDVTYLSGDGPTAVEIHWRLDKNPIALELGFEQLWAERTAVEFSGLHVETFGNTHRAIHLVAHGCISMWGRLFWLYDWHTIVTRREDTDWDEFLQVARSLNMMRMVALTLFLSGELLNTPAPERLSAVKIDPLTRMTAKLIVRNMQQGRYPSLGARMLARLLLKPGLAYKAAYANTVRKALLFSAT